jgi:uncharacterized membrane protein required for colicin V production
VGIKVKLSFILGPYKGISTKNTGTGGILSAYPAAAFLSREAIPKGKKMTKNSPFSGFEFFFVLFLRNLQKKRDFLIKV